VMFGFSVPDQLQVNTLIVYSEALFTATPRTLGSRRAFMASRQSFQSDGT